MPRTKANPLTLAERMILLRHRMGITQIELGRLLGVSDRTIKTVESENGRKVRDATVRLFEILESRYKHKRADGKVQVHV